MMLKNIRTIIFTVLLGSTATLSASPVLTITDYPIDTGYLITYYSDPTMTVEIGWRKVGSCPGNFKLGVESPYFTREIEDCSHLPTEDLTLKAPLPN